MNSINIALQVNLFPPIGQFVNVKVDDQGSKASFHYYCNAVPKSRNPTVILEHGGGGCSISFVPISQAL
jgi:hypothetical protein